LIFADIATIEDAVIAAEYGADFVAPTLKGYYPGIFANPLDVDLYPDFKLLANLVRAVEGKARIIMEGKVYTPEQAVECLYLGAHAVVVGNAITRPHITAKRFVNVMNRYQPQT
jgi:N-acylglucosamine-6-phosphate 2-epimerase